MQVWWNGIHTGFRNQPLYRDEGSNPFACIMIEDHRA